jgi:putative FmdB family regulatory protein
MPLYEYYCNTCNKSSLVYRKVVNRDDLHVCGACMGETKRLFSVPSLKVENEYFHPVFGEVVKNKAHYKELQRKHGTRDPEGGDEFCYKKPRFDKETCRATDKELQQLANEYGISST